MKSLLTKAESNLCAARGVAGARHLRSSSKHNKIESSDQCGPFGCYRAGGDRDGVYFPHFQNEEERIARIGAFMAQKAELFVKLDKLKKRLKFRFNITPREGLAILSKWSGGKAGGSK